MKVWLLPIWLVVSFLAGNLLLRYREKRLAHSRSGQGFETFIAYFSGEDIPRDKLRLVYEYFQSWQFIKNFPVRPSDNLSKVYGIVDDDLDDALIELAARWRAKLPPTFDGLPPVRTVADVVYLLHQLPRQEETICQFSVRSL
jgi:hypothetical protein